MQDSFRAFVLGLGMLLGLVEGGTDPALAARLHRDRECVMVSAEITNGVSKSLKELVTSGNAISMELHLERDGRVLADLRHTIVYLPDEKIWQVSRAEDGRTLKSSNEAAAYLLLTRWDSVRAEGIAPYLDIAPGDHLRVMARATIQVNNAPWEDSRLLWNYKRPERVFKLRSVTEVPF
jgi:hypothetical protein